MAHPHEEAGQSGQQQLSGMTMSELQRFGFSEQMINEMMMMARNSPQSQLNLVGDMRKQFARDFQQDITSDVDFLYQNRYGQNTQDAKNRGLYNSSEARRLNRLTDSNYLRDIAGAKRTGLQALMGAYGGEREASNLQFHQGEKGRKAGGQASIFGALGTIGGAALGGPIGAGLGGMFGNLFGGGGGGGGPGITQQAQTWQPTYFPGSGQPLWGGR